MQKSNWREEIELDEGLGKLALGALNYAAPVVGSVAGGALAGGGRLAGGVASGGGEVDTTMIMSTEGAKPDGTAVGTLANYNQAYLYA